MFLTNHNCEQKQIEKHGTGWLAEIKEEIEGVVLSTLCIAPGHFLSTESAGLEAIPSIPPLPVSALESDPHLKRVEAKNP